MQKIKTAELTGPALDWAVSKCRGFEGMDEDQWLLRDGIADLPLSAYNPSTDWAQGGPIIERECITVSALYAQKNPPSPEYDHGEWGAYIPCGVSSEAAGYGPTPLIAAMRCYCSAKLGDEIDIPEELCQQNS